MPIIYHEKTREFHLYNETVSYLFGIIENEQLGQLYYGKRIMDHEDYRHLSERARRDMAPYTYEGDSTFSLEHIMQEYPTFGCGDMRYPAYELERENGSRVVEFRYKSHSISHGKPVLQSLPATYVEEETEAVTLEIIMEDNAAGVRMHLFYTVFEEFSAIARSVKFYCFRKPGITLLTAMSGCVDFPDKEFTMVDLAGAWGRERYVRERELEYGLQGVYSRRGCSSYQFNPFLALKRKNASEDSGQVYGFSLVYSGNFLAQAEVDNYDVTRVIMGIHPDGFQWKLEEGESFQTPELVMIFSDQGMNGMSQNYHKLYRTRLARGSWRDKERPILLNSWEAVYFDFNEERLLGLARQAKNLGIELFVMDDGWFGERNDDKSSLGDWYPNRAKLPDGVAGLSSKIKELGLAFGIWIEPEMVNKDSVLYREHPDWVLGELGKNICHSRNQYILDFSKEEVTEYIYEMLSTVLRDAKLDYIKWDMNRTFSEVFSNGNNREYQGKVSHKYILGVYALYERLTSEFPDILFESCASGGARFDPGMLYYAPQTWASDSTDAVERLKIQYGTSMVYPLSSIGSHVSASPNHQTHRSTSMETRANTAFFGTFGYELDLNLLGEDECRQIKRHVAYMKQHRKLFQQGTFYRLLSPFEGNITAWMVVSEDKTHALVGYYRVLRPMNAGFARVKLAGLLPEQKYRISGRDYYCYGDELMQSGLITSDAASGAAGEQGDMAGDYMSKLFEITAEKEEV